MVRCKRENIEQTESIFTISCHANIINFSEQRDTYPSNPGEKSPNKYYLIKIPENVDLFIYTSLGNRFLCEKQQQYYVCNINEPQNNSKIKIYKNPSYQYSTGSLFPNLLLYADPIRRKRTLSEEGQSIKKYKLFYSGILHCGSNCIIYNMDAKPQNNCYCSSILEDQDSLPPERIDCTQNNWYTTDTGLEYQVVGEPGNCGQIYLQDAINKIVKFSNTYLNSGQNKENTGPNKENRIQIHLLACLNEVHKNDYDLRQAGITVNEDYLNPSGQVPNNSLEKCLEKMIELPNIYTLSVNNIKLVQILFPTEKPEIKVLVSRYYYPQNTLTQENLTIQYWDMLPYKFKTILKNIIESLDNIQPLSQVPQINLIPFFETYKTKPISIISNLETALNEEILKQLRFLYPSIIMGGKKLVYNSLSLQKKSRSKNYHYNKKKSNKKFKNKVNKKTKTKNNMSNRDN